MLLTDLRQIEFRGDPCRVAVFPVPEHVPTESELVRSLREVERRERQLDQALAAVAAQREQLAAVQAEYERRRLGLIERTREVEAERDRLRAARADLVAESLAQDRALH
jgi:vacuolar-type H+-ATPase subunit I/STV1